MPVYLEHCKFAKESLVACNVQSKREYSASTRCGGRITKMDIGTWSCNRSDRCVDGADKSVALDSTESTAGRMYIQACSDGSFVFLSILSNNLKVTCRKVSKRWSCVKPIVFNFIAWGYVDWAVLGASGFHCCHLLECCFRRSIQCASKKVERFLHESSNFRFALKKNTSIKKLWLSGEKAVVFCPGALFGQKYLCLPVCLLT